MFAFLLSISLAFASGYDIMFKELPNHDHLLIVSDDYNRKVQVKVEKKQFEKMMTDDAYRNKFVSEVVKVIRANR